MNRPTGWELTSSTGTSVSSSGFIPGTGNQQNGRIQSPSNWNTTAGKQATIYVRLSRAAISANGNDGGTSPNNTARVWWDSVGNPYGAFGPDWPPAVFTLSNSGGRYLGFVLAPTTFSLVDYGSSGYQSPTIQTSFVNPSQISPNIDKDFVDLVVTWTTNDSNVTTVYIYVDSILVQVKPITTNGALSAGMFRLVTIGNSYNGPNPYLGGNLGPFTIQRFQISTAFCPPIPSRLLIGVTGDSYTVGGGGFSGDGGIPSVATYASIYGNNSGLSISSLYNSSYVFGASPDQNPASIFGVYFWGNLLQSFSARQLGIRPTFFSSAKGGYANYFTGYQSASPRDNPLASTPLTIYTDALNSAKPPIVMELDSVNNQIQMDINNYLNTDCVGDLKWRYDYMAANNPNLRAIILIEAMSLERLPIASLSPYATANPTNAATISAYWRNLLRAAFYTTKYYAGNRVPVIYVPTYEQCAGASDGNLLFWGSNPANSITEEANGDPAGTNGGPNAFRPDIHITVKGSMRIADIVWAALKPVMKAVLSNIDVEIPFASPFDQTSITPNCALGVTQIYTINGNATINAPINASSIGTRLRLKIIQNTTGSYTATFNSLYRNAPSWGTGLANKTAYAEFECLDVITNTWQYIGGSTAFA
jgi:hypothetical protein